MDFVLVNPGAEIFLKMDILLDEHSKQGKKYVLKYAKNQV